MTGMIIYRLIVVVVRGDNHDGKIAWMIEILARLPKVSLFIPK